VGRKGKFVAARDIRRRIERIHNEVGPRSVTMEDVIRFLELREQENLTQEESQRLEELRSLLLSPTSEASLKDQT
jgi:hypothetical protein